MIGDLEQVPLRHIEYRGVTLREMDLDAIMARRPQIAVVDELAHTNAPGSTHQKRYEDVLAVLEAGIDVISAVNIQHIESLNDAIASTTGVRVRETVPDWVLKRADEVVNVDVSVETLRAAAPAGKNLRRRQDRAGAHQLLPEGQPDGAARAGPAPARLGPGGQSAGVPASAKGSSARSFQRRSWSRWRRAAARRTCCASAPASPAGWRPTGSPSMSKRRRKSRAASSPKTMSPFTTTSASPRQLGAKVVKLKGSRVADALVEFAKREGITHVIFGQSARSRWDLLVHGSIVDRFLRDVRDATVQIVPVGTEDRRRGRRG